MVDALVSYLVKRLGNFLITEVAFVRGVRNEVAWLRDELKVMQRFLKDAEEKQYEDLTTLGWLSDIRELAYDIEDLLDIFQLEIHSEAADDEETTEESRCSCFTFLCSCIFDKGKEQVNLYRLGKKIEEFRKRLIDLSGRRQLFKLEDSGSGRDGRGSDLLKSKELRKTTSFTIEENVVGLKDDTDQLLNKLLEDEPRRFVISIFGMGGLGKTTLARKLYHCAEVKTKFKRCGWVSVSQDYTARGLILRILMSFGISIEELDPMAMDEVDLGRHLHDSLQHYSYLLVLDDVWNKDVWEILKRYIPDNRNGSRVIITTRNYEIAKYADERTYSHNLQKLSPDDSWQLFLKKVHAALDDQFQKLGRKMVQKCHGLPLAIIVLAGLLSKKNPQEWYELQDQLWRHLKKGSIEIHFLLTLSFDCLNSPLKPCFLYLGLFPEDYEINVEKLIRLLVAEGLIPQAEDRIMEEVAKEYVDELISRSLIQVEKRYWGRIATCRVHDLLRDLAIEKAKSYNFLYIYDEVKHSDMLPTLSSCMRQATYSGVENPLWLENCNPRLRSLFLFAQQQQVVPIGERFSSLRVLDVDNYVDFDEPSMLAEEMGKLIHLKYLRLRCHISPSFHLSPSSVSKLRRLQTVDTYVSNWFVYLPVEVCKLQELRHLIGLFGPGCFQIDNLTKLQTLKYVPVYRWSQIKTAKLVNLRELWLYHRHRNVCSLGGAFSFDSMSNLKSLRILSVEHTSFESLEPLSNCQHLIELRLDGKLEKLPGDIHELFPNLQLLSLRISQLKDDPMPLLEKLPRLTILHLGKGFYNGKNMMCRDYGFLLLEVLLFDEENFKIEKWQVGNEALPQLRGLRIPEIIRSTIPERLRSLPTPDPREYTIEKPDDALYHSEGTSTVAQPERITGK